MMLDLKLVEMTQGFIFEWMNCSNVFRLGLILILLTGLGCKKGEGNQDTENEKMILLKRIEEFNTAFKECNIEKLDSMITKNYRHTNGSSKSIDRKTWINYLQNRRNEIEHDELIVNTHEIKETEIELYENMAIVTAKIVVSTTRLGENHENEYRVTNVWVKEHGIWKRAGFHDGKIK